MAAAILACWNGEQMPLEDVRVSVLDRAFLFGDAVYEAMRVYRGRAFLADRHFNRLRRSLHELHIGANVERLKDRTLATLAASKAREGLIYIQVTRGCGTVRSHAFPENATPNELIWVSEYAEGDPLASRRSTGVDVITFADLRWARRDIKTVNLLGNCLAAQRAREANAYESLLVESSGAITEGAHTSAFFVKEGRLRTSPRGHQILPGVTRDFVLELATAEEIAIEETPLHENELPTIEEAFLTGTSTEVLGVTRIDGRPVADGNVGPITQRLARAFTRSVETWLAGPPK